MPKETNGKGVLAVFIKADMEKSDYYYVHYRVYYDDENFFIVDPALNKGFAVNLEPGEYVIKKIAAVYNSSGNPASVVEKNIPFIIKPNTVTILSNKVTVWFNQKDGNLLQYWKTEPVKEVEREELIKNISEMKNGNVWREVYY